MKTSKSFNQEYIEKAKTLIHEILEDKKEYDDWTQICFSMQNAVQAAANIWGISSDERSYSRNAQKTGARTGVVRTGRGRDLT